MSDDRRLPRGAGAVLAPARCGRRVGWRAAASDALAQARECAVCSGKLCGQGGLRSCAAVRPAECNGKERWLLRPNAARARGTSSAGDLE